MRCIALSGLAMAFASALALPQAATSAPAVQRLGLRWDATPTVAGVTLRLVAVDDQRCPVDVQCISAGRLQVEVSLSKGAQHERVRLGSGPGAAPVAGALGLTLHLCGMEPRPRSDRRTPRAAVRVDLEVSTGVAGEGGCAAAPPGPALPER